MTYAIEIVADDELVKLDRSMRRVSLAWACLGSSDAEAPLPSAETPARLEADNEHL